MGLTAVLPGAKLPLTEDQVTNHRIDGNMSSGADRLHDGKLNQILECSVPHAS